MLTRRQVAIATMNGAIYWALAILFIRFAGPHVFVHGSPRLAGLYVALIPVSWAFVELAPRVAGFSAATGASAVTVMCLTALMLDGLAIGWAPSLYGLTPSAIVLASAWLLWWFGVLLAFAFRRTLRAPGVEAGR